MRVLVLNSGSSSLKYELFSAHPLASLFEGEVERIGESASFLWQEEREGPAGRRLRRDVEALDHATAIELVLGALSEHGVLRDVRDLVVVGHRVVHGGPRLAEPTILDDEVMAELRRAANLAPLHAPGNLAGIEAARELCPGVPHVAVLDTAFHRTMPAHAREYALPRRVAAEHGIRRYGFHGTSHSYVSRRAAELLGRALEELALITLHLGNGASVAAILGGRCIDTSMGLTPLEGLVMGTRCGDLDPAVPLTLQEVTGASRDEILHLLNFESGLAGLCGRSDLREVHQLANAGDLAAELALDIYCYRAKKYIGAYYAALGRLDALVFTAGVGEHDPKVRSRVCEGLDRLGITLDEVRNEALQAGPRSIHLQGAEVHILVIPTDEEAEIARLALATIGDGGPVRQEGDEADE